MPGVRHGAGGALWFSSRYYGGITGGSQGVNSHDSRERGLGMMVFLSYYPVESSGWIILFFSESRLALLLSAVT